MNFTIRRCLTGFTQRDTARDVVPPLTPAMRLLIALRAAGSRVFIEPDDDGDGCQLFASPPLRRVEWPGDSEQAFDDLYWELKALVEAEGAHNG